jgi:hypothetical protein
LQCAGEEKRKKRRKQNKTMGEEGAACVKGEEVKRDKKKRKRKRRGKRGRGHVAVCGWEKIMLSSLSQPVANMWQGDYIFI